MLYHLVWASDWQQYAAGTLYTPPSLQTEGFVHATRARSMLLQVAEQFFPHRPADTLLVMLLDEAQIAAPIRDEDPGCGHLFPHIYGPVPVRAISVGGPLQPTAPAGIFRPACHSGPRLCSRRIGLWTRVLLDAPPCPHALPAALFGVITLHGEIRNRPTGRQC